MGVALYEAACSSGWTVAQLLFECGHRHAVTFKTAGRSISPVFFPFIHKGNVMPTQSQLRHFTAAFALAMLAAAGASAQVKRTPVLTADIATPGREAVVVRGEIRSVSNYLRPFLQLV